jgi:prepilin-type N-terminal cleavage/methylation domain-containing protein
MKKGFSLIELVIVIAIIGLLSSMLFPNFAGIQVKAKETSLKAIAHSIQISIESYCMTNGTYPEGTDLHITELVSILQESGDMIKTPQNPFTNSAHAASDTSGKITYTYNSDDNHYLINTYGSNNTNIILALENI